eukprot:7091087-Alexandrium_andersonii.AAC.1
MEESDTEADWVRVPKRKPIKPNVDGQSKPAQRDAWAHSTQRSSRQSRDAHWQPQGVRFVLPKRKNQWYCHACGAGHYDGAADVCR